MSPLNKRLPRELMHNFGRYLGLLLLMAVAIAAESGFLSSARSIQRIQDGAYETYHMEDFHFVTQFEMGRADKEAVCALGCALYEDFSVDLPLRVATDEREMSVRLYAQERRKLVNNGYYFEGAAPASPDEIALDRVFCANNNLHVGDMVRVGEHEVRISGIMSLSDYQCQMQKNTDLMFNSMTFSVAQVSQEGFDALAGGKCDYRYDVVLNERGMALPERVDFEEDLSELLTERDVLLTDLVDRDSNMGIFFATDDVESDQVMWEVLLGILIVIMAFVFVVLTSANIEQESAVIGTLLASGYRKGELLRHYMVLPTLTGLVGGIVGNVAGYTLLSAPMRDLYYNSYSLPPFVASFDAQVFFFTTVVPFVLLVGITFVGLVRKLGATPLAFLRNEVGHKSRRANLVLPARLPFGLRFRLRVFLRNASHFVVLFFGISFCSLLLLFGLCMMPLVEHYVEQLKSDVVASHLYMLKAPLQLDGTAAERAAWSAVETLATTEHPEEEFDLAELVDMAALSLTVDTSANPVNTQKNTPEAITQAERFCATSLNVDRIYSDTPEEVTVYGIEEDSRYWSDMDVSDGKVVIGAGMASKMDKKPGDVVTYTDKYTNETYDLTVASVWGSSANMSTYMSREAFIDLFDKDEDYFSGYASDVPLALDQRYVATEITPESMSSAAEQMQESMGSIMGMMLYVSVPIYLVLIYLLTKTVIDRSARYISYMKVFGYHNREVSRLYVRAITTTVLVSLVASLPFVLWLITILVRVVMDRYAGNLAIYIAPISLVQVVAIGAAAYAAIALMHVLRIRRVSLALALKVQE